MQQVSNFGLSKIGAKTANWRCFSSSVAAHTLLISLYLSVTLAVRSMLTDDYAAERRQIELNGRARRASEMAASWNKARYISTSDPAFNERFLEKLEWGSLHLPPERETMLREKLTEVMEYLRAPSLSRYLQLKTNGMHLTFEPSLATQQSLKRALKSQPHQRELEPGRAVSTLWSYLMSPTNKGGEYPRLTAVSIDHVKTALSYTNSATAVLKGPVSQGMTIVQEAINPGFRYTFWFTNVNQVSAAPGSLVCVSFLARSNTSTNATPVYLSLRWSEVDGKWAPDRLFTDVLLNFRTFF